jgi:hypothetical protein
VRSPHGIKHIISSLSLPHKTALNLREIDCEYIVVIPYFDMERKARKDRYRESERKSVKKIISHVIHIALAVKKKDGEEKIYNKIDLKIIMSSDSSHNCSIN